MAGFRNIRATLDDPVAQWGFEGLLAAIERGGMKQWNRIADEVRRDPYGSVARLLEREVVDAISHQGERELFRRILVRARRDFAMDAKKEVVTRLKCSRARV